MLPAPRLRSFGCAVCFSLLGCVAHGQFSIPELNATRSVSGQFIVTGQAGSPLATRPEIATNTDFVRLDPALAAISAERIRDALRRQLDPGLGSLKPDRPVGKIYLVLHPAQSTNEDVIIVSRRSVKAWDYQIRLPDVLSRVRFVRALTGVLLLDLANRHARARSAEVPAWLTEGLSQELLADDWQRNILSLPARAVNGVPMNRSVVTERGLDPLAGARRVLRDRSVLTFEQLSWPTGAQLSGDDGGVYRASAQLFVSELMGLNNGPARLRAMLDSLPQFYNWQTAFQAVFRRNFPTPLEVEKWWAVQVVSFAADAPGPAWTPAVSRDKLGEILSVPVALRTASNALPAHVDISLQAVIRNFDFARQNAILQAKLRDLQLYQLRLAAPYAALADGYRRVLEDYLAPPGRATRVWRWIKHPLASAKRTNADDTLKKLDALDARRRSVETAMNSGGSAP